MPTPDNPSFTTWIDGGVHGKNFRLRFVDYGHDCLDLQLNIEGKGIETYGQVPRENSVRYEKNHQDDEIDRILFDVLTSIPDE